jgi:hypothetical protein
MNATSGDGRIPRDPEELETQIEGTRRKLSETLDALESKLSPRQRLSAAADSLRDTGERLGRTSLNALCPDITTMIRMDHTHVLALLRRFKPRTSASRKLALAENACLALEIHAQLEEEIFYPALRAVTGPNPILDKSGPEHDRMRTVIASLREMPHDSLLFDDTFRMLMREVLHHVADEETITLPLAEELMGDRLGTLGAQMMKRRAQLLGPHVQQVARTSVRSFPVLSAAAAAGTAYLLWVAARSARGQNAIQ